MERVCPFGSSFCNRSINSVGTLEPPSCHCRTLRRSAVGRRGCANSADTYDGGVNRFSMRYFSIRSSSRSGWQGLLVRTRGPCLTFDRFQQLIDRSIGILPIYRSHHKQLKLRADSLLGGFRDHSPVGRITEYKRRLCLFHHVLEIVPSEDGSEWIYGQPQHPAANQHGHHILPITTSETHKVTTFVAESAKMQCNTYDAQPHFTARCLPARVRIDLDDPIGAPRQRVEHDTSNAGRRIQHRRSCTLGRLHGHITLEENFSNVA
uniref:Uncharacterized protein n=1 Tax=Anopheles culicifacies TaxID=139723 RepID=A0A182M3G2_9DIPT